MDAKYLQEIKDREQEREKGCKYCTGDEWDYQSTPDAKFYLKAFGEARAIVIEDIVFPVRKTAFRINYCPHCGRELKGERGVEEAVKSWLDVHQEIGG